ncbi:MAG: hypothetical protein DVB26_06720 [Verrucomicrobia bacterium]|nr:MAG: hypothetical protein DVB26_06720 [Verrucomicrobiota bacterium]
MKSSLIPIICSLVLATLSGAALSHWWSLREFSGVFTDPAHAPAMIPVAAAGTRITMVTQATPPAKLAASQSVPAPPAKPTAAQKEFFESLLDEMKLLKQTNLALRDQMAETNRDLMQLEFRVDTQSASFRPLPVTENLSVLDTSTLDTSDSGPGVLPPRAVMVANPN